jgi:hypothetical protein
MLRSARRGLADAQNESIETDSQFDLAYGAAHRFALAALRQQGYRSENRITVFQTLVHTLGTDNADIQIFLKAHNERNLAEYEGRVDIDAKLLGDLIRCTKEVGDRGRKTDAASRRVELSSSTHSQRMLAKPFRHVIDEAVHLLG